jgi:hypothetical protein
MRSKPSKLKHSKQLDISGAADHAPFIFAGCNLGICVHFRDDLLQGAFAVLILLQRRFKLLLACIQPPISSAFVPS